MGSGLGLGRLVGGFKGLRAESWDLVTMVIDEAATVMNTEKPNYSTFTY